MFNVFSSKLLPFWNNKGSSNHNIISDGNYFKKIHFPPSSMMHLFGSVCMMHLTGILIHEIHEYVLNYFDFTVPIYSNKSIHEIHEVTCYYGLIIHEVTCYYGLIIIDMFSIVLILLIHEVTCYYDLIVLDMFLIILILLIHEVTCYYGLIILDMFLIILILLVLNIMSSNYYDFDVLILNTQRRAPSTWWSPQTPLTTGGMQIFSAHYVFFCITCLTFGFAALLNFLDALVFL
ncbi:hypothetical protein ACJX0J_022801 [Zea mays]